MDRFNAGLLLNRFSSVEVEANFVFMQSIGNEGQKHQPKISAVKRSKHLQKPLDIERVTLRFFSLYISQSTCLYGRRNRIYIQTQSEHEQ